MIPIRADLLDLAYTEVERLLSDWGQPRFRAAQLWRWLYQGLAEHPEEMTNLPQELRQRLAAETSMGDLSFLASLPAEDELAEKVLLKTVDGQTLEAVLMHYAERHTLCVSSQIGCPIGCGFCATGQQGFVRNLSAGEIVAQALYFARRLRAQGAHVTNIVLMGMGEPLLNFEAVWKALQILHHPSGLGLGARRFTLSTAGVVPGIERLAHEALDVGLAISLHAPDNALRDQLVPINRRYPLEQLLAAVRCYIERLGRRVTFEYTLIKDLNDSDEHARRTAALLRGLLCHVNLIPLNPTCNSAYQPAPHERVLRFQEILAQGRLAVTVRLRRGLDIQAGCGQLRAKYMQVETDV